MAFKGRINIREIEKNPVHLDGTEAEPWVQSVLQAAAPDKALTGLTPEEWAAQSVCKADVSLETAGSDYLVRGTVKATVPTPCSRCGDDFKVSRDAEFNLIFHRLNKGEEEADSGDANYVFLNHDEIDLVQALSEQLVILEPVAECPARKADGSCVLCGKNPHFGGQRPESSADSPFAKLGSLKIELGKKSGKKD